MVTRGISSTQLSGKRRNEVCKSSEHSVSMPRHDSFEAEGHIHRDMDVSAPALGGE